MNIDNNIFPFKTSLSFSKLISFWKTLAEDDSISFGKEQAKSLLQRIKNIPELNGSVTDINMEILEKHHDILEDLMTVLFPIAQWDTSMMAVMPPYTFTPFYMTPKFKKHFVKDGEISPTRINMSHEVFKIGRAIGAYTDLLKQFYNIDLKFSYPTVITITDEETGLDRYFNMNMDGKFMDLKIKGELPNITEEQIKMLSENMMNLEIWTEIFPPDIFEFTGFVALNMIEVTDQEALSQIKYDLLDKNVLATSEGFEILQQNIKVLFRNPRLILGLAVINKDRSQKLKNAKKIIHSFLLSDTCLEKCNTYDGSIYETVMNSNEPVIIYDLNDYAQCTAIEETIKEQGIRNIFVAPLRSNQEVIGILEVGSPVPGEINSVSALKLNELMPLLTIAVKNAVEELENKIQAVIKEKCTAIHPSVEWRFRDAAMNLIENQQTDPISEMEEIVFQDVYPLYGLSDIRDSSKIRNDAIQDDLCDNLEFAKEIVNEANSLKQLPILEHMIYRIDKRISALQKGLHTGDEASVVSFLHKEVEPLYKTLKNINSKLKNKIDDYYQLMNPRLGIYYNKRKDYEKSVSIINETISSFVTEEEEKAQRMFPHYFERYKTDGVEYTIYLGESISQGKKYDPLYLKNLRLWQLLLMSGVATRSAVLKEKLPVPLETANLILVQDRPLTIRFHLDQKKFDVDGTYNVHYEIMKKRIDKAEIKGTEERLTQPGKLAIVYTQNSEANEYRQYIDYLQYRGIYRDDLEELELEDLQGVYGLKALRVTIETENGIEKKTEEELLKAVNGNGMSQMKETQQR